MKTAATIEPFMVAMISATVIASGTAEVNLVHRDGDDREHEQRRADHHVGADALDFRIECIRSPNASRLRYHRTCRSPGFSRTYNKYNTGNRKIHTRSTKCQ